MMFHRSCSCLCLLSASSSSAAQHAVVHTTASLPGRGKEEVKPPTPIQRYELTKAGYSLASGLMPSVAPTKVLHFSVSGVGFFNYLLKNCMPLSGIFGFLTCIFFSEGYNTSSLMMLTNGMILQASHKDKAAGY